MHGDVRLIVEEVAQRVTDRARLEQIGRDLIEQRLERVVVVAVDEHDVDVGICELARCADTSEAAAQHQHPRALGALIIALTRHNQARA